MIDMVLQDAEPPKEPVPEYDMPIMHTHFRKEPFAVKEFGKKVVDSELQHWDEIGKNPSICRKLYGLGSILNDLPGLGFNFDNLDNHVWLPQLNLKTNKRMFVCFNCGSLKMGSRFIPYTDLEKK